MVTFAKSGRARTLRKSVSGAICIAAASLCAPALAIEADPLDAAGVEPPRLTVERDRLVDAPAAPLDARGRPVGDVAGVSVRLWSRHGRSDIGIGLGALGFYDLQPLPPGAEGPASLRATRPTVTLGWRFRLDGQTSFYADATSARRLATEAMPDLYATKVGMEWKPATSRFGFEHRSLGIQLQSGYRMSLRIRGGGVGVYFRGQF